MKKTLLLWDIDGTLLKSKKAGHRASLRALSGLLNRELPSETTLDTRGRTDRAIAEELFAQFGLSMENSFLESYRKAYLEHLPRELEKAQAEILPGVLQVLEKTAKQPSWVQGLLTGNFQEGATIKLQHVGIAHYFGFGAFGDAHADRNALGPIALAEALRHSGISFESTEIFVIGDTPHDILCGQAIGAHTIAVTTGTYSHEELQQHKPSALLENLQNTERFFQILEELTYS